MRQLPSWMPWAATIAAAAVIIVVAAQVEGLKIQATEQKLEAPLGRATVYPGEISASPTIVAPQEAEEVTGLEKPPSQRKLRMSTALRSGPGTEYVKVTDLTEGEQVWALSSSIKVQDQEWQRVRTDGGQVGWCMVEKLIPVSVGE